MFDSGSELPDEPVAEVAQAIEAAIDKQPVAAVFVPAPNTSGYIWIFARGLNNTLYRRIYSLAGFWVNNWQSLDTWIADIPSVALYGTGPYFGVVVYARSTDNHIWELY